MTNECVFCRVVSGELPSHKVYEDDEFLAIMDIDPVAPGHALVIPKRHYRWVWDVPNIGGYFEVVRKVARALQNTFGQVEEIHSRVVGEEVPHAHVWLYPNPARAEGIKEDLEGNAEKIRKAIQ